MPHSTNSPSAKASRTSDKAALSSKAARIQAILSSEQRVKAVCADIVEHYKTKVGPIGPQGAGRRLRPEPRACASTRSSAANSQARVWETTVVMTTRKDDPTEWQIV